MKIFFLIISVVILSIEITTPVLAQKKRVPAKSKTTAGKGAQAKDMLEMLQGRWSSLEDKKTFFQIEGDRQIDIYGRDILDTAAINFYDECPKRISTEDEKRRSGKYLTVQVRPNDFYCYSIDKISTQQLTLTYLPKGSILRYKKVPSVKLQASSEEIED